MHSLRILLFFSCALILTACKQPLAIEGEGDIIELNYGARGCALEEFRAGWARCTDNEVFADESVRYQALPRPGWLFSHWQGCFGADADICTFDYVGDWAALWDEQHGDDDSHQCHHVSNYAHGAG